ncbi:uncharacterized protein LOC130815307 [Amaranthus tricolor]|uniref:uncharacterized protein LOC130815307 n=1 Tax=Amaranthus tricolor TaxID=29722 RepID=UPI00258DF3B9|nr:uncharacterized protein LOC130815307 [Amaranthus tricolor]
MAAKGTVTPLSTIFPADEARKASQRVNDTILDRNKELDNLNNFVADNTNLINIVRRLPDELHHHIMVPFGKAAFFPGRLVHTNEFMVLLGEGYFAERSAKQTVDILKRRGQMLDSQVNSLNAVIKDLKAEASFFDKTAAEAVEGLVEIREDLTYDENSSGRLDERNTPSTSEVRQSSSAREVDDEEYARMMARLDELEKEEEQEEQEGSEEDENDTSDEDFDDLELSKDESCAEELSHRMSGTNDDDKLLCQNTSLQPEHRDISSLGKGILQKCVTRSTKEDCVPPVVKKSVSFNPNPEVCVPSPRPDAGNQASRPIANSLKAFSGSIIERTDNLQISSDREANDKPSNSKPVSRFKMLRRGL